MKARAIQKNIHLSPRKAKLVCDLIRNKKVTDALVTLEHTNKKAAPIISKLLNSAIANATNNHAMQAEKLYVYHIVANQGATLKRTSPRAKGSADLIRKRHCHIEIIISDDANERQKELDAIKDLKAKRAKNNKGYSAKQRAGKVEPKKKEKNVSTKKPETKKVVEKKIVEQKPIEKKPVVSRPVDPETLKREQEVLKVVDAKPTKDGNKTVVETTSIIMISVSPKHADILLDDSSKNVFFYKVTPINKVKRVLIYATAPIKAVVGEFDLSEIKISALSTAWKNFSSKSVFTKKEFDEYYQDKKEAHAMVARKSFRYSKPKNLSDYNMTKGPSGFQYLK